MSWTLWRGGDLLGTVHQRSVPDAVHEGRDRRDVNAVLVPDPVHLPLQSVRQYLMTWAGSEIVRELDQHPDGGRVQRTGDRSSGWAIGAWPVSNVPSSPPASVPPTQQLHIRDENGRTLRTRSIGLREHRPHPDHPPSELATLPEGAVVRGSIWLVHFSEDLTTPST